jgi:hypothetical protein
MHGSPRARGIPDRPRPRLHNGADASLCMPAAAGPDRHRPPGVRARPTERASATPRRTSTSPPRPGDADADACTPTTDAAASFASYVPIRLPTISHAGSQRLSGPRCGVVRGYSCLPVPGLLRAARRARLAGQRAATCPLRIRRSTRACAVELRPRTCMCLGRPALRLSLSLRPRSLAMRTQNIFSSIHHIESLNTCMKY